MRRPVLAAPLLVAAVLPLLTGAACGSPATAPHGSAPRATTSTGPFAVAVIDTDTQGRVFTDSNFHVLYRDTHDHPAAGRFDCVTDCLKLYHPLLTQRGAALAAPPGVTGALAAVDRPDGAGTQVTVNGYPVYTFSGDQPGDTGGLTASWQTIPAPVTVGPSD